MTWPNLPESFFVAALDGTHLLVDRRSGWSAKLDAVAAVVIDHRGQFADRDDAIGAMVELFGADPVEVAADLDVLATALAAATDDSLPWVPPPPVRATPPTTSPDRTWTIDALGEPFEVAVYGVEMTAFVGTLLSGYRSSAAPASRRFEIWSDEGVWVAEDGWSLYEAVAVDHGLAGLDAAITIAATRSSRPGAVLIHAAGLVDERGRAIVLTGASNQGKSSTAVELVDQGWRYLTDEVVQLVLADGGVSGLPRAIGIEGPVRHHRPHLQPAWIDADTVGERWSVPAAAVGAASTAGRLAGVVALEFVPGAATTVEELSTVDATAAVAAQMFNTGALDADLLAALCGRLADVATVRVRHGGASVAAAAVIDRFGR